ncbi:MAG: deoxyribonuclease IV [Rubrobacter sp.]|nr:deoxyribonuclease IV [Rubrobacter sp.]
MPNNENHRTNRIGRHLPTSGGLKNTLQKAAEQECETIQIFVSNPQQWADPNPRPDAEAFINGKDELGVYPLVAHAKYLINLASKDEGQRGKSTNALARELVAAGELGVDLVVVHSGSHGGEGEEKGMEHLVEGLDRARELAAKFAGGSRTAEPLVENSCGAGTQLCSDLDTLASVLRRADVRCCFDTCHAFVAGHDLSSPEAAKETGAEIREKLDGGIGLFHLNDARNSFGSRRDGHARIGEGEVPEESWTAFFGELPNIPVAMETPYATPEVDADQIRKVKELVGGLRLRAGGL